MKMGKVIFNMYYIVDIDDEDMMNAAKQCICEDIMSAVKYDELESYIETQEDPNITPDQIPEFLCPVENFCPRCGQHFTTHNNDGSCVNDSD